jgi:hypothetical protein
VDRRGIPTIRLLADEGRAAFEIWASKPDKIRY